MSVGIAEARAVVTRYQPPVRVRLRSVYELLVSLVARDVRARYKQSILGFYWAVLNPLFNALIYTVVFSMVLRISAENIPFPIFLLSGLVVWNVFGNGLLSAIDSVVKYAPLVAKVPFPREVLPVSAVLARLVDFAFSLVVLLAIMLGMGLPLTWHLVWLLPIIVIEVLFTIALALPLAAANLFYRDIQQLLSVVLMAWMYITPLFWPVSMFPENLRFLFWVNPMGLLVYEARQALLYGRLPHFSTLGLVLLISLVLLAGGTMVFRHYARRIPEIL